MLESFVSVFDYHLDARRNIKEEHTMEEFMIAVNGLYLVQSLIEEAMNS